MATERKHSELYQTGMKVRRQVLGDAYVDAALAQSSAVTEPLQELVTEFAWGGVWGRPGLPLRTRSLINIAMLTALNRPTELRLHLRGALRNGCTQEEIGEVLLQTTAYCGFPAAIDGFRVAREVFESQSGEAGPEHE
ncbi:MAG TPA: carboxymuconolactone decarboxylase family protein [Candidatus Nitrosotalea sp.]|nr:carboxymuconolactone decarboxylase family protein [Candidatus Nitrosotalea sp.]